MQNRSKKRWLDIQIILASLAVTFTLGLWNVFARGSRPVASPVSPPTPDPTFTFTYAPTPTAASTLAASAPLNLPKVHLLLGGKMPVAPVVVASSPGSNSGNQTTGPKNGGSNPNPPPAAPPPAANTGSSKP
jgi:hypothetical protein